MEQIKEKKISNCKYFLKVIINNCDIIEKIAHLRCYIKLDFYNFCKKYRATYFNALDLLEDETFISSLTDEQLDDILMVLYLIIGDYFKAFNNI